MVTAFICHDICHIHCFVKGEAHEIGTATKKGAPREGGEFWILNAFAWAKRSAGGTKPPLLGGWNTKTCFNCADFWFFRLWVVLDDDCVKIMITKRIMTKQDGTQMRGDLEVKIEGTEAEVINWMFLFWIGQAAATAAIVKLLAG